MTRFITLVLSGALALLTMPLSAVAADAHGTHHAAGDHSLQLNAGKKWHSDAPLRQGMTAIRGAAARTLPQAHAGKASSADYDAFGDTVLAQVAYMVENCKLPAEADAQLHLILADAVAGAEAAQGKRGDAQRAAGVLQVAKASNAYGQYFEHKGWKALKLPH